MLLPGVKVLGMTVCGVWRVACGVWRVVCGVWCVICMTTLRYGIQYFNSTVAAALELAKSKSVKVTITDVPTSLVDVTCNILGAFGVCPTIVYIFFLIF
jgi:hypothetical protein